MNIKRDSNHYQQNNNPYQIHQITNNNHQFIYQPQLIKKPESNLSNFSNASNCSNASQQKMLQTLIHHFPHLKTRVYNPEASFSQNLANLVASIGQPDKLNLFQAINGMKDAVDKQELKIQKNLVNAEQPLMNITNRQMENQILRERQKQKQKEKSSNGNYHHHSNHSSNYKHSQANHHELQNIMEIEQESYDLHQHQDSSDISRFSHGYHQHFSFKNHQEDDNDEQKNHNNSHLNNPEIQLFQNSNKHKIDDDHLLQQIWGWDDEQSRKKFH